MLKYGMQRRSFISLTNRCILSFCAFSVPFLRNSSGAVLSTEIFSENLDPEQFLNYVDHQALNQLRQEFLANKKLLKMKKHQTEKFTVVKHVFVDKKAAKEWLTRGNKYVNWRALKKAGIRFERSLT